MTRPSENGWYWILRNDGMHPPEVAGWDGAYFRANTPDERVVPIENIAQWQKIEPPADFVAFVPN